MNTIDEFLEITNYISQNRCLPENFNDWELKSETYGWTVAHYAMQYLVPPHIMDIPYHIKDKRGITVAHVAAERGFLKLDFTDWHLKDKKGWTIAHEFIYSHDVFNTNIDFYRQILDQYDNMFHVTLPNDFNQWDMSDSRGWSVAHLAAKHGMLTDKFNMWHLKDAKGHTVAHIAAMYRTLPKNFDQWDLVDRHGRTVEQEYLECQ